MNITIKRIYDPKEPGDGYRVLVDRLWPRGISKEKASWDEWLKNIAPSTALRQWFAQIGKEPLFLCDTSNYLGRIPQKVRRGTGWKRRSRFPSATAGAEREGYSALLRQKYGAQ